MSDSNQAVYHPHFSPPPNNSRTSTAFNLLETDTFWLSYEPFKPGAHFPGACCPRLATFALFQLHLPMAVAATATAGMHRQDELGHGYTREVAVINTHLDNVSDAQRKLGAAMVLHRARYEAHIRPGVPVLVTGDLNRCIHISSFHSLSSLLFQFFQLMTDAVILFMSLCYCPSFIVLRADLTTALMPCSRAPCQRPRSRTRFYGASRSIPTMTILRVLARVLLPPKRRARKHS